MATLTTHILNSVNGAHAAGVRTELHRIEADGRRTVLLRAVTDAGGRLRETITLREADAGMTCELVFQVAEYFSRNPPAAAAAASTADDAILREAVFRFTLPDPHGTYHIPMMLAPNSYSVWCSG